MFAFVVALGASAIVVIALAPLYAGQIRSGSLELGAALVALAISAALLGLMTTGQSLARKDELFLCSFVLLMVGSILVLGDDGHDDDGLSGGDGDEPPWWPEFEDGFRTYAGRARRARPLARIR